MTLSPDPKWLSLIQTCLQREGSDSASGFVQLATLTTAGHPAVRTVVFRGWFRYGGQDSKLFGPTIALKIVTDVRSEKVAALRKYPWAEICWYFDKARQQFRLNAKQVRIVEGNETDQLLAKARKDQWTSLSDAARLQFRFPTPGAERSDYENGKDLFKPEDPSPFHPEDTFVLLLVEPHSVDVLDLRANERWLFSRQDDNSWIETFVNP